MLVVGPKDAVISGEVNSSPWNQCHKSLPEFHRRKLQRSSSVVPLFFESVDHITLIIGGKPLFTDS